MTKKQPRPKTVAKARRAPPKAAFPVVGIGASAGGLEALQIFLKAVSARSGMAFVVIQHMDPTREGMLVDLLGRVSPIPVVQAADGARARPDHVYVIPPNKDLSLVDGVLHLLEPAEPRGLRLPIDSFFRSLADDMRERGVGVLLSGMGTDGTLGLAAIRAKGGGGFVQTPASAKFDAMPRSAIDAGVADVIAPAEELPVCIAEYLESARRGVRRATTVHIDTDPHGALEKIIGILRSSAGQDFSPYKRSTLSRRVERRMGLHQINDIAHYVRYLRETNEEVELLSRELLIGVTGFFRDAAAWERLKSDVLAPLILACPPNATLRAWVPACSTGEEAYSLGMAFKEALDLQGSSKGVSLQVFATDLDLTAVERARQGVYAASIASDVSPERLKRFFVGEDGRYRVRKEIRDLVIFATQNVLQDPPFTKLDVLTCRNLLIYLTAEAQRKVIPLFHYSLNPGGTLFLGSAETVGTFTDLFSPIGGEARLYRRLQPSVGASPAVDFPLRQRRTGSGEAEARALGASSDGTDGSSIQTRVERILLQRFAPAAVLVSESGDVLFVSGRTGKYLELPAGKVNWNVLAMAREGLRHELATALHEVVRTNRTLVLSDLRVSNDADSPVIKVTLDPIDEIGAVKSAVLIAFVEVAAPEVTRLVATKGRVKPAAAARLERELARAQEDLRRTRHEAQTAQEELKSANEELQSTNEELQSTNEELTTSKEEMQSMNEELRTLNAELQANVDDLTRASNDMKNLLDSTAIAVLFLDDALNVRRFTPQVATLFKLIPSDVGRPLADFATNLDYPALYDDARDVLATLVFKETTVASRDGRRLGVRIMPYRTSDNKIDGVVITFLPSP